MTNPYKPLSEIPKELEVKFISDSWLERNETGVEVSFWADDLEDGEATLEFFMTLQETNDLEEYGISDDIIYWMNEAERYDTFISYQHDPENGDIYRTFKITDSVIDQYCEWAEKAVKK